MLEKVFRIDKTRNLNPLSTYLAHWGYSFDGWGHQMSRPHKCIHLKVEGREKTCKKRKYEKVFSVYAHTNNVVQSKTRLCERLGLLQSWLRLFWVGVTNYFSSTQFNLLTTLCFCCSKTDEIRLQLCSLYTKLVANASNQSFYPRCGDDYFLLLLGKWSNETLFQNIHVYLW